MNTIDIALYRFCAFSVQGAGDNWSEKLQGKQSNHSRLTCTAG